MPSSRTLAALLLLLPAAVPALVLAAVPEPTEAEIRALTEKDIAKANQPIIEYHHQLGKGEVPPDMLVRLNGVRKLDCTPADGDAYDCNVEIDMMVPNGGRRVRSYPLHFTRTGDGWKAGRKAAPSPPVSSSPSSPQ